LKIKSLAVIQEETTTAHSLMLSSVHMDGRIRREMAIFRPWIEDCVSRLYFLSAKSRLWYRPIWQSWQYVLFVFMYIYVLCL